MIEYRVSKPAAHTQQRRRLRSRPPLRPPLILILTSACPAPQSNASAVLLAMLVYRVLFDLVWGG